MFKRAKIILPLAILIGLFFIPCHLRAQTEMGVGLEEMGAVAGLAATPLPVILGRIVKVIISVSGLALALIIIYAGVLWMRSGGEAEKINRAKKMMIAALIGLAIIIFSYAITSFILGALEQALGLSGGGGEGPGGPGGGGQGGLPSTAFKVKEIVTSHDVGEGIRTQDYHKGVYLCSNVEPIFNNWVDANQISNLAVNDLKIEKEGGGMVAGNWLVRNNVIIFKQGNLFEADSNYSTYLPKAILDQSGQDLKACKAAGGCLETDTYFLWKFTTGATVDTVPPTVIAKSPEGENVPIYTEIETNFSEPIDASTVVGEDNRLIEANISVSKLSGKNGEIVSTLSKEFWRVEINNDGFKLTPEGNNLLEPFTWYRVSVKNIEDLCQNKMAAELNWEFKTNDLGKPCQQESDCESKCCLTGSCHREADCLCNGLYDGNKNSCENDSLCCWGTTVCYGQGASECQSFCQNFGQDKCGVGNTCCWSADSKCHSSNHDQCEGYCAETNQSSCNNKSTCCWGQTQNTCLVKPNDDCPTGGDIGDACEYHSDCTSPQCCSNNKCADPSSCGTDSGQIGEGCQENNNCQSGCCKNDICVEAVNCGGNPPGSQCKINKDCQSSCCKNNTCVEAVQCETEPCSSYNTSSTCDLHLDKCCWGLKEPNKDKCLEKGKDGNPDCTLCDQKKGEMQCGISCCSQKDGCAEFKCKDGRTITSCKGAKCDPCAEPSQNQCGDICCTSSCEGIKCASCAGYVNQKDCQNNECCWTLDSKCRDAWSYEKDPYTELKYCPNVASTSP